MSAIAAATTAGVASGLQSAAAAEQSPPGRQFYVAPDGNDWNPGTLAAPLATLEGARDAVRAWRRRTHDNAAAPVTVRLRGGVYRLTRSFTLDEQDSGSPRLPVTYTAYDGEQVRLVGGADLPGSAFVPVTDQAIRDRLPASSRDLVREVDLAALGISDYGEIVQSGFGLPPVVTPPELFFNGQTMTLARYPSNGFLKVGKVVNPGGNPRSANGDHAKEAVELAKGATFQYTDTRPAAWLDTGDVWMAGYWYYDWADGNLRIKKIDPAAQQITTTTASWYSMRAGQRYFYYNVLEELDTPGEWYLDRATGKLYLLPPGPLGNASVQLSLLDEPMIVLDHTSHVVLSNLTFEAARGDGIRISDGTANTVEGCTLQLLGGKAIVVGEATPEGAHGGTQNQVRGCHIRATGRGGIVLGGGDRRTLARARNEAIGNEIHDYSRLQATYSPAVEIGGVGNRAAHNHIYDAPHVAILFRGNDHLIEFNEINDVVKQTNDAGAIYAGRDWTSRGTVIRYNFLHNIVGSGGTYFAAGIYLDDVFCGTTVFGNIFYDVNLALLVGGGRDNGIANNLILSCDRSLYLDDRGLGWAATYIRPGGGWGIYETLATVPSKEEPWRSRYPHLATITEDAPAYPKYNVFQYNALYDVSPLQVAAAASTYGTIDHNLTLGADPGVVEIVDGHVRLVGDDRIAAQLPGYQPIPMDEIGLI